MRYTLLFAIVTSISASAFADDLVSIDQVPPQTPLDAKAASKNMPLPPDVKDEALQPDHQAQILNDPLISDFGRTQAIVGGNAPASTGNSVTVNQNADAAIGTGKGNKIVIHQNGDNNTSKVLQKGHDNDLYLDQVGNYNASDEQQIGSHNHKVKVQNGVRTETSDDPYDHNDK